MKLSELQIGDTATILSVGGEGALRQHFLDMGLIHGGNGCKVCADGRPCGTSNSRIRVVYSSGRC